MTSLDKPAAETEKDGAGLTGVLFVAAAVSAISALLYGYDTGIISAALLQIQKDFHTGSGTEQVIAGSILFGAVLGALTCSRLSERQGRKRTILLVAGIFAVGPLSCSVAPNAWALSLCRIVLGFAVGGATQTVPMYVAELAPPARRGRLVLTFQVGIGVGIVVSTIVGATETLSWRVSVGLAVIPATLLLPLMLRLPESPRWLVKQDRRDDAREVLAVRGAGTSAQAATLWSTNLLITLTLLTIIDTVGVGPTMWLYAAFNVAAVLFVWRRLPELTGRSLEQIESRLRQGHFRPAGFAAAPAK